MTARPEWLHERKTQHVKQGTPGPGLQKKRANGRRVHTPIGTTRKQPYADSERHCAKNELWKVATVHASSVAVRFAGKARLLALHQLSMGLGRRKIRLEDASAWVFNRMAHVYDARPDYPVSLIDALVTACPNAQATVLDLGAGIGHLTIPLAARGLKLTAVEPAKAMLDRLVQRAHTLTLPIEARHGTAEALPFCEANSVDLVLIADALHFLDAELVGREVGRVLAPGGVLAVVGSELADTPYMRALQNIMYASAPRRPRATDAALRQLCAVAGLNLGQPQTFLDETPVDAITLERILGSISFIGPAMNAELFEAFRARIHAIEEPAMWARRLTLQLAARRAR